MAPPFSEYPAGHCGSVAAAACGAMHAAWGSPHVCLSPGGSATTCASGNAPIQSGYGWWAKRLGGKGRQRQNDWYAVRSGQKRSVRTQLSPAK